MIYEERQVMIKKIYYKCFEEMVRKVNELRSTRILLIEPSPPDFTTIDQCARIYYEVITQRFAN